MPLSLDGTNIILNTLTREYEQFRNQQFELAGVLTPEWTDFYPHDPGVILAELFAGNADILSYYIDRVYGESHWNTAQLRQSIIDMAALINYTPRPASASTVTVNVTLTGAGVIPGVDSTASAPFQIANQPTQDQSQFSFELLESYTATGAGTVALTFIEGTTIFQENVGTSNGRPGQIFRVLESPITTDLSGAPALRVESPLGTVWTQVSNFIDSEATDRHYTLRVNASGEGTLTFGDGVNGRIPTSATGVFATYRIGGGVASNNIGIGKITRVLRSSPYASGVTNTTKPTGGQDAETVEQIRAQAPLRWSTQDRIVTHEDYETAARAIPGVFKAKADWYQGSPLIEAVWVATAGDNPIPTGTWSLSKQRGTGLLGAVGKALVEKSSTATRVMMLPITPVNVVSEIRLHLLPSAYRLRVEALVTDVLRRYVRASSQASIPQVLSVSGLYKDIESVDGVDYLDLLTFRRTPYIETVQVGLADTTFSSVTTQGNVIGETLDIVFDTTTTFYVEGSETGIDPQTGTVGSLFTLSNGTLSWTFTAGSIPNQVGDRYRIKVGSRVGNIEIQPKEIAIPLDPTITFVGGIGE